MQASASAARVARGAALLALLASHAAALTQALVLGGAYPYVVVFHAALGTAWLLTLVSCEPTPGDMPC